MKTLTVNTGEIYNIFIGENILADTAKLIKTNSAMAKIMIVSDDIVYPLYGEVVQNSLENAGLEVHSFVFKNGETSKQMDTVQELIKTLSLSEFTRGDMLIALGGGVVGDLTGFAASIYLRGIPFIQIPTTLLAMVDSSVGGKTGVNSTFGKNLIGSFYQPSLVICDTSTLESLPRNIFLDGICEAIKYGIIRDKQLFNMLSEKNYNIEEVTETCLAIKKEIVEADEYDKGTRQLLNFGHTIGHAVEKLSDYKIRHGRAVAIGMAAITKSAELKGLCEKGCYDSLIRCLRGYGIDSECEYTAEQITEVAVLDKKRSSDKITLVIPKKIGNAELMEFQLDCIKEFFRLGIGK